MQKNNDIDYQPYIEGEKLLFDTYKHLTTLCTGSILVLIALLEKLFREQVRWKLLVIVSVIAFLLSTAYSLVGMTVISRSLRGLHPQGWIGSLAYVVAWTMFMIGLMSLMTFIIRNLSQ